MKNCRWLTKTEYGLLLLTALFLAVMVLLVYQKAPAGMSDTYRITTQERGEEVVPPSALPVNINTAAEEELQLLPGVGPVLAERIIDYRTEHGPFTDLEQLKEVSGIGDTVLDEMRDQIILEDTVG